MPEFIMESYGVVNLENGFEWRDLSDFTQGYIEALFFTESSDPCASVDEWRAAEFQAGLEQGQYGGSFPGECGFSDLAPATLARIIEDCAAFDLGMARNIQSAMALDPGSDELRYARESLDRRRIGQLFWYARNGHGVSFTDDGNAQCLENLQKAAKRSGEVWLEFGDDDLIHMVGVI